MKIKVPEARETVKASLEQEESSSSTVSPPSSTPGSPTAVDTELDVVDIDSCANKTRAGRRKRPRPVSTARKPKTRRMKRLVSKDLVEDTNCVSSAGEEEDDEDSTGSDSKTATNVEKPSAHSRCISEDTMCHEMTEQATPVVGVKDSATSSIPPLPNPLHNKALCQAHISSLRLESELAPMKSILFKLMGHAQYNRHGIFNAPVDPVALSLADYNQIIKTPMDLGTIKAKLHALAYSSREQVADDVRLVFRNAILYNPQEHFVHVAARNLLGIFEAGYLNACQRLGEEVDVSYAGPPEPFAAVAAHESSTSSQASIPTSTTASLPAEKPADENTTSGNTNGHLPASPTAAGTAVKKRLFPTSPPVGTRRQPQAAPKLPVQIHGDGKVPPWLRPNRKKTPVHSCSTCLGRTCAMCEQGCLTHEPTLLICSGTTCGCAKIRKLAVYYVSPDGTRQYCQKCYAVLSAVLPQSSEQSDAYDATIRYKKDLLKRKNDEEIAENWLTCTKCQRGVHQVCAMHNEFVHDETEYVCPMCVCESLSTGESASNDDACSKTAKETFYTFVTGSGTPIPMDEIGNYDSPSVQPTTLSADQLKETPVSAFIQQKVRERMVVPDCPNADQTVSVRIISDCEKSFNVPDVVRKHFRVPSEGGESHLEASVLPPETVGYRSIAIALFQKIDGLDVCIFCMYVQEYDGDDEYESDLDASAAGQGKRVYIAYLDSVEHFRPRSCRTDVYHEMLVSYLATARARGYETAHIWACPPARGNSFVFWNHPSMQRTPTKERLISWYHGALHRAVDTGVVTDIKSMYESAFEDFMSKVREEEDGESIDMEMANARPGRMVCPPLLDGDYWIEEAQRLHAASLLRFLKSKSGVKEAPVTESTIDGSSNVTIACPALQVALLIRDISAMETASPFRRPVNAAALNLKDYHSVISKPMDLGTIYSQCVLGEYDDLKELVSDVSLVFNNAKRYNPVGHPIHTMAIQVEQAFYKELNSLSKLWQSAASENSEDADENLWLRVAELSMSLDTRVVEPIKPAAAVSAPAPESLPGGDGLLGKPLSSEAIVTAPSLQTVVSSDELSNPVPEAKEVSSDLVAESLPVASAPVSANANVDTRSSSTVSASDKPATAVEATPAPKRRGRKPKPPPKKLDLLTDGPDAVHHSMVGDDIWLLDNRPPPPKNAKSAKKNGKRKKTEREIQEEPPSKRRRQSWLGEQVGVSMRKIRTSFFTCSLMPKAERTDVEHGKLEYFDEYIQPFDTLSEKLTDTHVAPSSIADARHHLLEFSQYRNFEFDTLRRAKYSTAMLLYHLHYDDAPGLAPSCSSCSKTIHHVRWHEIRKRSIRNSKKTAEELCLECHSARSDGDKFIPLPVSFRSND